MLLLSVVGRSWAQAAPPVALPPPPDVSVTSVGVQTWTDSALRDVKGATDLDLALGERLRWTLAGDVNAPGTDVVGLVEAQFLIDSTPGPDAGPFEWSQVRQLGVEVQSAKWTLDLGRSLVYRGGPRLVDGAQALYHASQTVKLGAWAGLEPDLFTSDFRLRPGGGPIVAYETSKAQLSLVGEVSAFDGAIDRTGVLAIGRYSFERVLDLAGRVDLDLSDQRLVDGQLLIAADPDPSFHAEAMYDGFSSFTYQETELLDPRIKRFAERLQLLGLANGIEQDTRDPNLNHLLGASARWQPDTDGLAPRVGLTARYLAADQKQDGYARVDPSVGLVRIADLVDVTADVNYLQLYEETQIDAGVLVYVEPRDGAVSVDTSLRIISDQVLFPKPTYYADLFLNVVSAPLDLLFIAGGEATSEPDLDGQDSVGFGAFVRMAKYVRPKH